MKIEKLARKGKNNYTVRNNVMAGVVTLLASYPYPVVAVARIGSESLMGKLLNWMV